MLTRIHIDKQLSDPAGPFQTSLFRVVKSLWIPDDIRLRLGKERFEIDCIVNEIRA